MYLYNIILIMDYIECICKQILYIYEGMKWRKLQTCKLTRIGIREIYKLYISTQSMQPCVPLFEALIPRIYEYFL